MRDGKKYFIDFDHGRVKDEMKQIGTVPLDEHGTIVHFYQIQIFSQKLLFLMNWQRNYDDTENEPVVLPARIPNLLVNGANGIAVGMTTNIPPHNLTEVISGLHMLMKNPDATTKDLMKVIPGPDFPTGGIIMGRGGIYRAYESGKGNIVVRAKTNIETEKSGRERIIVSEIPFMVNKAELVKKIADLAREKTIDGITGVRDESGPDRDADYH